jgi:hypothetical protein
MKYLLFAGNFHYPEGGVFDLTGKSDSIEELKRLLIEQEKEPRREAIEWFQIVEKESMVTVCASDSYDKYHDFDNSNEVEFTNLNELKKEIIKSSSGSMLKARFEKGQGMSKNVISYWEDVKGVIYRVEDANGCGGSKVVSSVPESIDGFKKTV